MDENQLKLRQLLEEKLKAYFEDKEFDVNGMVNSFSDLILKYIDCDYTNLIAAIDRFINGRQKGLSSEILSGRTSFDVSIDDSEIKVKTFFHKGFPALYFYRNGEEGSFFKIKEEIKDGAHIFKARYKSSENAESQNFERNTEEYIFKNRAAMFTKVHTKKAAAANTENKIDLLSLADEQYEFLEILKILLNKNNVDFGKNLSSDGKDLIFNELYMKAVEMTGFQEELKVNEILRVLIETLYQKNGASTISRMIDSRGGNASNFYANNGLKQNVSVANCGETIMLDVYNSENECVCKYNIFKTAEGFTIYRNYTGKMSSEENPFSSMTINLTDNMLKLSVLGGGKSLKSPIEITAIFNEDGSLEFGCNENIVFESGVNPLGKRQREVEEMY